MENKKQIKEVFEIPNSVNIDGLNLGTVYFGTVHNTKVDEKRLKRGEDVLIATYPRTGTTWLCQIVSLLLAGEENYEDAKKIPLQDRALFLEQKLPYNSRPFIDMLDDVPTPRVSKTHLPYRFIKRWISEDRLKTIITSRHPKDTLVSMFHFYQSLEGFGPFRGTWNDFFEHVKAGKQLYGEQLSWMQDWDRNKQNGDILFLKYEDMKLNIEAAVKKIAAFLEIELSDNLLEKVIEDVGIQKMKSDSNTNMRDTNLVVDGGNFIRGSITGEWKRYFTVEQNEWFDANFKEGYVNLGIDIVYE